MQPSAVRYFHLALAHQRKANPAAAQLALRLNRKKLRTADKDPTAEVVVLALPPSGPPQETARKFVQEWQRKGAYKEALVEDAAR